MAFNPMKLLQLKPLWGQFKQNHPKFPAFLQAAQKGLEEGSVISISIKTPEGREIATNIKLTSSDMHMIDTVKSTFSK